MANTMRHINIIGHQNPDTDSICSALAYAWLKNRGSLTGLYEARTSIARRNLFCSISASSRRACVPMSARKLKISTSASRPALTVK